MFDYEPIRVPIDAIAPDGVAMLMRVPPPDDRNTALGLERFLLWEEQQLADRLHGYNKTEFVCGRLALRAACRRLGAEVGPILRTERGAPSLPLGLTGSIAHRKGWVLAVVDWSRNGTVGVDVESLPPAPSIEEHVLAPVELEQLAGRPAEPRARALLARFALKEALFKALDPHVRNYLGFHDVAVIEEQTDAYRLLLRFPDWDSQRYRPSGYAQWWGEWVFASARVQMDPYAVRPDTTSEINH